MKAHGGLILFQIITVLELTIPLILFIAILCIRRTQHAYPQATRESTLTLHSFTVWRKENVMYPATHANKSGIAL